MDIYRNGWTRETVLARLEERNGFEICSDSTRCTYRENNSPKDRTCFAGAFIPDEAYRDDMEGNPACEVLLEEWCPIDQSWMEEFQRIHDEDLTDGDPKGNKKLVELFLDRLERDEQVWENMTPRIEGGGDERTG